MTHPVFTLLTAVLLAAAMTMLENRAPRERLCVAARFFFWCVASAAGGGWLMRLIHG